MKKNLLMLFALTASFCAQAQDILLEENCSGLTAGNVGTVSAGPYANLIPGQGGWKPMSTGPGSTATDSDFQIVDMGGANGNAFQIIGPADGAAGNSRRLLHDFNTNWTNYYDVHAGDVNVLTELEVDYFSGSMNGSLNTSRLYIWDDSRTTILAGFYIDKADFTVTGIINLETTPAGSISRINFESGLDGNGDPLPQPTFLENTWYRLGVSVDFNVNKVIYRIIKKDDNSVLVNGVAEYADPDFLVATAGKNLGIIEFTAHPGPAENTISSMVVYDNFVVRGSATDTLLLSTKENKLAESIFAVSPNPATDVIKVTNSENISVKSIAVTDLNGRVVKSNTYSDASNIQVNISDLASGMYLMKITSDKGVATKKIIKN